MRKLLSLLLTILVCAPAFCADKSTKSVGTVRLNADLPNGATVLKNDFTVQDVLDHFKTLNLNLESYWIIGITDERKVEQARTESEQAGSSTPAAEEKVKTAWYLYNPEIHSWAPWQRKNASVTQQNRFYGAADFGVAIEVLGHTGDCTSLQYDVKAVHTTPQNVQNLQAFIQYALKVVGALEVKAKERVCFGSSNFTLPVVLPADITVVMSGNDTIATTVHDESYHYWDVSIGMPLASYREVSFNAENNIVVPKKTDKAIPYGMFDLYAWHGADLGSANGFIGPKLMAGLPIGSRPLNTPFFGAGLNFGFKKFHFAPYAGVKYAKVQRTRTLAPGSSANQATLDLDKYTKRVASLMYGLSFSVTDAIKLFK